MHRRSRYVIPSPPAGAWRGVLLAALALFLAACAGAPAPRLGTAPTAYLVRDDGGLLARHAPVFVPEHTERSYNRLGRAAARLDAGGRPRVYVDPTRPVVYAQRRAFTTARGRYTNLIYRVHFEKVPFSLAPFHLTAGPNGGLIVVVTLDAASRPVLVTTVHSCGCYLGMVPTGLLPAAAYPPGWDPTGQVVYGEHLPGRLDFPPGGRPRLVIHLRHGTHRVKDLALLPEREITATMTVVDTPLAPMAALKRLPLGGGATTSFFRERGILRGHVKNTVKPFELLLMSWWALDPGVGVDKELGDPDRTGTVFYTSLKPWNRRASDLWSFPDFLRFWGWRL